LKRLELKNPGGDFGNVIKVYFYILTSADVGTAVPGVTDTAKSATDIL
jgi:hypothetical protein